MMTKTQSKRTLATKSLTTLATCTILTACGGGSSDDGGGGGNVPVPIVDGYIGIANTTATDDTPLGFVAINVANVTSSGFAGTLDHDGNTVSGGALVGTINNARTLVTLNGGGTATLSNPAGTLHTRLLRTSGLSNDVFGAVGQFTNPEDLPTAGSSTFNGAVQMQADNGNASFALTGDAMITLSWDGSTGVDSVFDNLDGTRNDLDSVQNVGTVTITGATLNGNSFSGGTFSTTGTDLAYTGGGTEVNAGQFFGPDATEVGGGFGLTAADQLEITGSFIAKGGLD